MANHHLMSMEKDSMTMLSSITLQPMGGSNEVREFGKK